MHRPRLFRASELVTKAFHQVRLGSVSDFGCGDGGLLYLLESSYGIDCWGYDFAPANVAGWTERGVTAQQADVFGADRDLVKFGDLTVVTEVLEHIADPHGAVRWIGENSKWIVASSPMTEGPWGHDECHAWAWDPAGYRVLIEQGGFQIIEHNGLGPFQLILGRRSQ
jgi:SAM-dependent methyltransferase